MCESLDICFARTTQMQMQTQMQRNVGLRELLCHVGFARQFAKWRVDFSPRKNSNLFQRDK